jgi:hypothetical protein
MAYPSVTYTFTNGTTASATEVNQNFTDLINGLSDGTKDLSISALTVAGTASLNGAVNIGNATSDDIAVNGYITTALIPKADDSYDLGTSALAWQDGYFDGAVYTDTISELTGAAGVTIDGVKLKDGGVNFGNEDLKYYDEGTWTPTWDNTTLGNGTSSGTYIRVGKQVTVSATLVFGSTTNFTGVVGISNLPFTSDSGRYVGSGRVFEVGAGWAFADVAIVSSGTATERIFTGAINGGSALYAGVSNTSPMTWAANDYMYFTITYITT